DACCWWPPRCHPENLSLALLAESLFVPLVRASIPLNLYLLRLLSSNPHPCKSAPHARPPVFPLRPVSNLRANRSANPSNYGPPYRRDVSVTRPPALS